MPGEFTIAEILSQPEVWAATLAGFDQAGIRSAWASWRPRRVITTGCGSTHYLAMSAAALVRGSTGGEAIAHPGSELALAGELVTGQSADTVLVAISRSGTTSETQAAVDRFRERGGGRVVVVTCDPDSPLAGSADLVLAAPAAQERSIAQTRSFGSMFLLIQAMAATIAGLDLAPLRRLPDACARVLGTSRERMARLAAGWERFYFLGSGVEHGLALEAMLKMKEMSLTSSEGYHVLEFRHGPMSMVDRTAAVVGLVADGRAAAETAVLAEMARLGAEVLDARDLAPPAGVWWADPLPMLPALQLLAYERAMSKGLDPDQPRHLSAVVELETIDGRGGER
jgi:glucosamine--fructose-6-phosphate aminotransferase (isomerizing)